MRCHSQPCSSGAVVCFVARVAVAFPFGTPHRSSRPSGSHPGRSLDLEGSASSSMKHVGAGTALRLRNGRGPLRPRQIRLLVTEFWTARRVAGRRILMVVSRLNGFCFAVTLAALIACGGSEFQSADTG